MRGGDEDVPGLNPLPSNEPLPLPPAGVRCVYTFGTGKERQGTEMEMPIVDLSASPGLPSVDGQAAKADRIRAMELAVATGTGTPVFRAGGILAFINGESTTTLQTPLAQLLQSCYTVFMAQDMKDHVAVFDRVTDMRDAFGGVLAAMDGLGIPRPKVEGAVELDQMKLGESDG